MKISLGSLCCFLLVAMLLGCQTQHVDPRPGVEFDKHLSMIEDEVRNKYGEPQQSGIYPANEFRSTLSMPVYKKYFPNRLNTEIKEMDYTIDHVQRIFWLEKKRNQWRVIGDAKFPENFKF